LQAVNLGYCSAMRGTDSLVAALAALPDLKALCIAGCFPDIECVAGVVDVRFETTRPRVFIGDWSSGKRTFLTHFRPIASSRREGPRAFRSLVQQIKGLQRIDVTDCLWFTDIEVESLYNMRLVPRLALLRLRGCVLVTRRALDALQEARPALVIVA
jgi:hypothetical protein